MIVECGLTAIVERGHVKAWIDEAVSRANLNDLTDLISLANYNKVDCVLRLTNFQRDGSSCPVRRIRSIRFDEHDLSDRRIANSAADIRRARRYHGGDELVCRVFCVHRNAQHFRADRTVLRVRGRQTEHGQWLPAGRQAYDRFPDHHVVNCQVLTLYV